MHRKERAIAPLLDRELGIQVVVPSNFDSDRFGTFTRDVDRPGDQVTTARLKARAAMEITGESLVLASEGSFGPHPAMPWLPCNRELVVLVDRVNNLEIVGEDLSVETNFQHQTVKTLEEARAFAARVGFPSHGLVVMPQAQAPDRDSIFKGIVAEDQLEKAVAAALARSSDGTIHIETDMRAMHNPTRMNAIARATENLVKKVRQVCPACQCPGFGEQERRRGLPCELCRLPTALTLFALYRCQRCGHQQEVFFPDGNKTADPTYCDYCNP